MTDETKDDAVRTAEEIEKNRAGATRTADEVFRKKYDPKPPQPGVDATINSDEELAKRHQRLNEENAKRGPGRRIRLSDLVFFVMPKSGDTDGGVRPAIVVNPGPPDPDPVGSRNKWLEAHPDRTLEDYQNRDKDEDPQPKVNLVVFIDGHPDTQWRKEVPYEVPILRTAGKMPGDLKPNTWHWPEQSPDSQEY